MAITSIFVWTSDCLSRHFLVAFPAISLDRIWLYFSTIFLNHVIAFLMFPWPRIALLAVSIKQMIAFFCHFPLTRISFPAFFSQSKNKNLQIIMDE